MLSKLDALTVSSILEFHPASLVRRVLPVEPHLDGLESLGMETPLPQSNRLIRNQALYFSEPEDVRKCIEKLVPDQTFCLILTNKAQ